jgi:predicted membrane-bound spermidine synthase
MATELIGAKVLAPYFGTSLYVWTCVMALTLGGLAIGYFLGGRLSQKEHHEKKLMLIVLLAAAYICIIPLFSPLFLFLAGFTSLLPAVLAGSAVVLLPPIFLMGMVSPLLIKSLTESADESGKKAGEVYAISTVGGILFCFLTGFYLVPTLGLYYSLLLVSVLLAVFPIIYFIRIKIFSSPVIYLFCATYLLYNAARREDSLYVSEGLLGRIEVKEQLYNFSATEQPVRCRLLLMNNVIQSAIDLNTGSSMLEYTSLIRQNLDRAGLKPQTALVLGLGGGVLSNELAKQNINVTAVELDTRIAAVARKYFSLSENVRVVEDDARHALYGLNKKFDLIVFDLFHGENTPSHVMSVESFAKTKGLLSDNGIMVINTYGYLKDATAAGNYILLHTLQQAGFNFKICCIGDAAREDFRNFEIFCSSSPITTSLIAELKETIHDLSTCDINSDERPVLEYANARAAKRWRYAYIRNFISQ